MTSSFLESLRIHQFVGNAYSDLDMFNRIHAFAIDPTTPAAEAAEALWIMGDKGMGLSVKEFDAELPDDWTPGVDPSLDAATVARYVKETT